MMRALATSLVVLAVASPARADDVTAHAARLLKSAIVVDTHEDVPWELREKWADLAQPGATKHVDLARLREIGRASCRERV